MASGMAAMRPQKCGLGSQKPFCLVSERSRRSSSSVKSKGLHRAAADGAHRADEGALEIVAVGDALVKAVAGGEHRFGPGHGAGEGEALEREGSVEEAEMEVDQVGTVGGTVVGAVEAHVPGEGDTGDHGFAHAAAELDVAALGEDRLGGIEGGLFFEIVQDVYAGGGDDFVRHGVEEGGERCVALRVGQQDLVAVGEDDDVVVAQEVALDALDHTDALDFVEWRAGERDDRDANEAGGAAVVRSVIDDDQMRARALGPVVADPDRQVDAFVVDHGGDGDAACCPVGGWCSGREKQAGAADARADAGVHVRLEDVDAW